MFAGKAASKLVVDRLNTLGNVMNLQKDCHDAYDALEWGIEAQRDNDRVRIYVPTRPDVTYAGD
jgi:hypothetical protein